MGNALKFGEEVNFQMRRNGYLGLSLFLLFALVVSALPGFGQDKQPQLKTRPEYDGYVAIFNEKDPAKKAALGEKFIAEFKESEGIPNAHTMTIGAYAAAKNWAKVIEFADRAVALPNADNKLKAYAYANAMVAAQNLNDVDKVINYGEKVLTVQPDDLNALVTLSAAIPVKLPTNDAAKKAALDKAEGYATKALAGVQGMVAKADAATKSQLVQIEGNLYATRGLIANNRMDYNKSIQEYEQALQRTPKDDVAHFYLGADYQALGAQASKDYTAALKAENDAKAARAEQPVIDELAAKRGGMEDDIRKYRDKAIDEYAIATALGGPVSAQAKEALTRLWTAKNDNTNGLEEFIAQKKSQLSQ
jgi:tetratricopeptide (TPR) repeat protein